LENVEAFKVHWGELREAITSDDVVKVKVATLKNLIGAFESRGDGWRGRRNNLDCRENILASFSSSVGRHTIDIVKLLVEK
jgi:hypothetical protein